MPLHPLLACAAIAAFATALGGCTTPYSQLIGKRYFRAAIDTYPVTVTRVDDRDYAQIPVFVDPGTHQVTVKAPPVAGFAYGNSQTITLDVQPCMRYYLVAVKPNPLAQDFSVKVDYAEPVAGCKVGA